MPGDAEGELNECFIGVVPFLGRSQALPYGQRLICPPHHRTPDGESGQQTGHSRELIEVLLDEALQVVPIPTPRRVSLNSRQDR